MINQVQFDIDESRSMFILKDEAGILNSNRRLRYYLFDALKATTDDGHIIIIKYDKNDREYLLKSIHDAFEKYSIEQTDSPGIKEVLSSYYREKENFRIFSEKAKKIWNNEVDLQEFKAFTDSVTKNIVNRRLYDKQLLAAFHLAFAQNACNFSVPGAGKTSVVYAAYAYLKDLPIDHPKHVNKLLVIGPLSSFGPWEDEYIECFGEPVKAKRLSGGAAPLERERHLLSVGPIIEIPELTLMSYQSVPNNLENLVHFLRRRDIKAMVVLDEAHRIKNTEGGVWATAALSIAKYCSARVVLTGTPVPNGYEDIYNLYDFIWPNKDIINFSVDQLHDMSENNFDTRIKQLVNNISPFFIRIKKSDLGLPPIDNKKPLLIKMGDVQREIYEFIENRYIGYFEENQNSTYVTSELIKARFIRLMQAATNPGLLKEPLERYFREQGLGNELYIDDRAIIDKILRYKELENIPRKFEAVRELVSEILEQNEKVIIWGVFIQTIKELQGYLNSFGINSELLIGEVPVETDEIAEDIRTREKTIKQFHSANSPFKVLIANPMAVAESISLHKACHHAIYLERTFNAANFMQSKDRIHRVGLPGDVVTHYHYVLSEDSIEETIHQRLIEKEKMMLELIESQEIPLIARNLSYDLDSKDDLKAIIRDYVRRTVKI